METFERIRPADDPADPNRGPYYLEAVWVLACPCGHRQEEVASRHPDPTLKAAQRELDARFLGKG